MSFITDAELANQVEAILKVTPQGSLTTTFTTWQPVIVQANAMAFNRIQENFLERGFTTGQIDDWDYGAEYQQVFGEYWALTLGAGLPNNPGASDDFLKRYEMYVERLPEVLLVRNGTIT